MATFEAEWLIKYVSQKLSKKQTGSIITIEIDNYFVLQAMYGSIFADGLMKTIILRCRQEIDDIEECFTLDRNIFAICCPSETDTDVIGYVDQLHNIVKFMTSPDNRSPIHVSDVIASLKLSQVTDAKLLIQNIYLVLKAKDYENKSYYHSYESVQKEMIPLKEKMHMSQIFKQNIIDKQLKFAFQPIVNSITGKRDYYESLLRIDRDGKIVSVGPYIPIAEDLGYIDVIDETVLVMAVEEVIKYPDIKISFNISGLAVDNEILLSKMLNLFSDRKIAERLIVEITETALQKDIDKAASFISALQKTGCQVALDDFGAGNSSFKQLLALPVDIIKIDGSFIRNILTDSDSMVFVKMLLTVCKNFEIKTVAEFVETGEIAKKLIELGVDYMQGNYFSPAVNERDWQK